MVRRTLARLHRMGGARRLLVLEAAAFLLFARLWLLLAPFRHVAPRLGKAQAAGETLEHSTAADADLARAIGWAVSRTARHVPFKAVCLQQAVAARLMLGRRGVCSVLSLGVATPEWGDVPMLAHAWLDAEGVKVTGYPVPPNVTKVACFV